MSLARRSPFKQFEGLTMHVFLTGATGFIGSMIVRELIGAGHQVTGLTRSDEGARQLDRFRARAHRGTIEDPASVVRDRKSVVEGKSVSVSVDLGGRRTIKKK